MTAAPASRIPTEIIVRMINYTSTGVFSSAQRLRLTRGAQDSPAAVGCNRLGGGIPSGWFGGRPLRIRGYTEGRRLHAIDVRKATLPRERADLHELT